MGTQFFLRLQNQWESNISASSPNQLTPGNGYIYHVFTAPGTLTVSKAGVVDVLIIAGGAAGGASGGGGGGGAGGVIQYNSFPINNGSYPVSVGAGGVAPGNNGNPSTFSSLTAVGGGGGSSNGNPGGSGGGTWYGGNFAKSGGLGYLDQGYPSGAAYFNPGSAGAGVEEDLEEEVEMQEILPVLEEQEELTQHFLLLIISPAIPAPIQSSWTSAVGIGTYAGGGGGGGNTSNGGMGGAGGGGSGGSGLSAIVSTAGTTNTGSGGGGGGIWPAATAGANWGFRNCNHSSSYLTIIDCILKKWHTTQE